MLSKLKRERVPENQMQRSEKAKGLGEEMQTESLKVSLISLLVGKEGRRTLAAMRMTLRGVG